MCDNIDALLADEGGMDVGDYDIRAEDEEALLEEDNFDDQNLVSSSNRNYYASREELEEEELDHEPEEPEEVLELDGNVSDLPDEDANDSLTNSSNQREKRDTKFVSERILPNKSFENAEHAANYNQKKLFGRPQQQQQQHFNNRNQMFNNRGIRGRGFAARGRGNIGNRPEGKKVLINPHFQGNAQFNPNNNQVRPIWHVNANVGNNAGRAPQHWKQQRMPLHPQHVQHQQFHQQNNRFGQQQQPHMDFAEPNRMVHIPPLQQQSLHQKVPVHQRLGNINQPPIIDVTQQQQQQQPPPPPQQFIDQQQPFFQPPQHHHQPPPTPQVYQSPPQAIFAPPNQQYIQPPPVQQPPQYIVNQQPQQGGFQMNVPPPQASTTFVQQQPQFSSPPPCYVQHSYEPPQVQQHNVLFHQQQHSGSFDFPPQQMQMQEQQVQFQHQQQQHVWYQGQQQPLVYQQLNVPPPNMPQNYQPEFQPSNETHQFSSSNPPQYIQNPLNVEHVQQQERRVYAPRVTPQNRLGPPTNKQQQNNNVRFIQRPSGVANPNLLRGGAGTSNRGALVSPGKRRYPQMEGGADQRRRRTELVNLRHEVPKVDSTVNSTTAVHNQLSSVAATMKKDQKQAEIEEDEETRLYRQKIENQKRIREHILAQKEERRKQAARKVAAENELASLQPPSEIVTKIAPKQSPIKTIVTSQQQAPNLTKRRLVNTVLSNRTITQAATIAETTTKQATATTTTTGVVKSDISSFLTNRRIIAKDQSLPDTSIVVVSNLAAGTTEVKLRRLCQGVGNVQVSVSNDKCQPDRNAAVNGVTGDGVNGYCGEADDAGFLENSVVCVEAIIETVDIIDDDDESSSLQNWVLT